MKIKICILLFLISSGLQAQNLHYGDSLKAVVNLQKEDTNELNALILLAVEINSRDSSLKYAQRGLLLAQFFKNKNKEAACYLLMGTNQIDDLHAIQNTVSALNIYERTGDMSGICMSQLQLQAMYREVGDYGNALNHAFAGVKIAEANHTEGALNIFPGLQLAPLFLAEISQTYILMNQPDSALIYAKKSISKHELFNGAEWEFPVYLLAYIQNMKGDYETALGNYRLARVLTIKNDIPRDTTQIYSGMSALFVNMGKLDSAVHYARIVAASWNPDSSEKKNLLEAISSLEKVYSWYHTGFTLQFFKGCLIINLI